MKKVIVTDIKWDFDDFEDFADGNLEESEEEIRATLPTTMEFEVEDGLTDDEVEEWLTDAISDEADWCHQGFEWSYADR